MGKPRSAFSLVELLVTISVAAVLVALTSAGINRVFDSSKAIGCLANLSAIGRAAALYSADFEGRLPQSTHVPKSIKGVKLVDWAWQYALPRYLDPSYAGSEAPAAFHSPLAPNPTQAYSYAINDFLTAFPFGAQTMDYSRRQSIERPSETMYFSLTSKSYGGTDHFHFVNPDEGGYSPAAFSAQVQVDVLQGSGHYLFVDGHVEKMPWDTVKNELTRAGSRFITPAGHNN